MSHFRQKTNEKGYIAISTLLIILMFTLGIAAALSFLSVGSANVSQSFNQGNQAFFLSDACLEEGLLRLKMDPVYNGGTIDFPEGQCNLDVADQDGVYTIKAYFSTQGKYQRQIEARAQLVEGVLQIISWEEDPFVID